VVFSLNASFAFLYLLQLAKAVEDFEDKCLMTFSMVSRQYSHTAPYHHHITEDTVKFHDMFDMAMNHALINQSQIMSNSVHNAIYETMKNSWTPGYTGPCYSQPESSVTIARRAAASAIAGSSSQPMAPSATSAGIESTPMPAQFYQPAVFQSVGTLVQSAPTYATASPTITSASKNQFSTSPGYVPTSSFGMPPKMMAGMWPQAPNSAGQMGFNHGASPSPQRSLLLVKHSHASPSAPQLIEPHPKYDPYTI